MSIDKSLKLSDRLQRPRSVLTRAERIALLQDEGRWKEGDSVFGLPKVRVRHARRRHKAAKAEAAAAAGAPSETTEQKPKEPE